MKLVTATDSLAEQLAKFNSNWDKRFDSHACEESQARAHLVGLEAHRTARMAELIAKLEAAPDTETSLAIAREIEIEDGATARAITAGKARVKTLADKGPQMKRDRDKERDEICKRHAISAPSRYADRVAAVVAGHIAEIELQATSAEDDSQTPATVARPTALIEKAISDAVRAKYTAHLVWIDYESRDAAVRTRLAAPEIDQLNAQRAAALAALEKSAPTRADAERQALAQWRKANPDMPPHPGLSPLLEAEGTKILRAAYDARQAQCAEINNDFAARIAALKALPIEQLRDRYLAIQEETRAQRAEQAAEKAREVTPNAVQICAAAIELNNDRGKFDKLSQNDDFVRNYARDRAANEARAAALAEPLEVIELPVPPACARPEGLEFYAQALAALAAIGTGEAA